MATKNKLAKQMIAKHSLNAFPHPWNRAAIRAIMDFAKLAEAHERKVVRTLARKSAQEKRVLRNEINEILYDHDAENFGHGIALLRKRK